MSNKSQFELDLIQATNKIKSTLDNYSSLAWKGLPVWSRLNSSTQDHVLKPIYDVATKVANTSAWEEDTYRKYHNSVRNHWNKCRREALKSMGIDPKHPGVNTQRLEEAKQYVEDVIRLCRELMPLLIEHEIRVAAGNMTKKDASKFRNLINNLYEADWRAAKRGAYVR